MTPKEFLKSKNMLTGGHSEFVISGNFGVVSLNQLLSEYAALAIDRCKDNLDFYDAYPTKAVIGFIEHIKEEFK